MTTESIGLQERLVLWFNPSGPECAEPLLSATLTIKWLYTCVWVHVKLTELRVCAHMRLR